MAKRLAVFSVLGRSVALMNDWAESAGLEVAVLVTLHGPTSNPHQHSSTIASVRRHTTVMVVPDVTACQAALCASSVDLGLVVAFNRVPDSVASIPRHGTVNIHPALLPAYRGPNGYRALYEGEKRLGATLHRVTQEIDSGPILAQSSVPTPENVEPASAIAAIQSAIVSVLDEGVPRALADEPGEPQDASAASFAQKFSCEEAVVDLNLSKHLFQCKVTALMLADVQPWVMLDERHPLRGVRLLPGVRSEGFGVVSLSARRAIVAVNDGVLELELGEMHL